MVSCPSCGQRNHARRSFLRRVWRRPDGGSTSTARGTKTDQRPVLRPRRLHRPRREDGSGGGAGPAAAVPRSRSRSSSSGTAGCSRSSSEMRSLRSSAPPPPTRTTPSAPFARRSPSATPSPATSSHVRIGVTTGEALVALDARPDGGEGMASGDVVNTAARLQAAAPVDGVLVDSTTHRATQRVIEYLEQPPVDAKGKAEPVPVWRGAGSSFPPRPRCRRAHVDAARRSRAGADPLTTALARARRLSAWSSSSRSSERPASARVA